MLKWFDWAGEYALPVTIVSAVVANLVVGYALVYVSTAMPYWLNARRARRARAADPLSRYHLPADYMVRVGREERQAAVGLAAVALAGTIVVTLLAWALIKSLMCSRLHRDRTRTFWVASRKDERLLSPARYHLPPCRHPAVILGCPRPELAPLMNTPRGAVHWQQRVDVEIVDHSRRQVFAQSSQALTDGNGSRYQEKQHP